MSERRTYRRLSVATVGKLARRRTPGMHPDGDGLYLEISAAGVPSWAYRFMLAGRARQMGLGPLRDVSLSKARELAQDARQLKREGVDPIEARKAKRQGVAVKKAKALTFRECAIQYITAHRAGWRSPSHAAQWPASLEAYVYPVIGDLPVNAIDVGLVMQILEPIWPFKPETARRVRGRIESILDFASARGLRQGDNPARWRGHLQNLLPKKSKVAPVKHHAALPFAELPAFMVALRRQDDAGSRVLEFAILTAARSGEVLGARWDEFEQEGLWTVPGARMKSGREHRVPLSDAATEIIRKQQEVKQNDFVFPGERAARAGKNTLRNALKALQRSDLTAHGFRSTFSDWCAEQTNFPREVVEMALAHAVGNKVEAAYRRSDLFAKRRQLAQAWASFCASIPAAGKVIAISAARK